MHTLLILLTEVKYKYKYRYKNKYKCKYKHQQGMHTLLFFLTLTKVNPLHSFTALCLAFNTKTNIAQIANAVQCHAISVKVLVRLC